MNGTPISAKIASAAAAVAAIILAASTAAAADGAAKGAEAALRHAARLGESGQYGLCAAEYSRIITTHRSGRLDPNVRYRLADCQARSGDHLAAAQNFRLFAASRSESPLAYEAVRRAVEAGARAELDGKKLLPSAVKGGGGARATLQGIAASERMNAAQVPLFSSLAPGALDAEMARLKAAGINTVIVRVFHNKGDRRHGGATGAEAGVYFKSRTAPVVADALGPVVSAARASGLKVYAWMTTRYADYGAEGDPALACAGFDTRSGALTRCAGLDLFNERAVGRLEAIYGDLASYDIDGVLFQDDLVLRANEGFGKAASALFEKETGLRLDPKAVLAPSDAPDGYGPLFWRWSAWKNKRLLDVADRLKRAVRAKRPNARFAVNLMYESVSNPKYALAWLSQSMEEAVRRGYDYYSIMAYHRQIGAELGIGMDEAGGMIADMAARAARLAGGQERALIKIQTIDWTSGEALPAGEVAAFVAAARAGAGGASVALVPYREGLRLDRPGALLASRAGERGRR